MVAYNEAKDLLMAACFSEEYTDQVVYNGSNTYAHIIEEGTAEDGRFQYDYVDVAFPNADVAALDYREDTLVVNGATWRRPKKQKGDGLTSVIRFRKNERPVRR